MKKAILGVMLATLAGAGAAQSNVTVFGIVDATATYGKGSLNSLKRLSNSGNAVSRIGFRGTEDLGDGLSAGFWLEGFLGPDDGTGGATNTNNQASGGTTAGTFTFGRRASVSIASRSLGELRLGRDLLPQYWGLYWGDVFGSVGAGAAVNYTNIITGVVSTRASNQIAYWSPDFSGLRVHAAYYLGENPSGTPTHDDGTGSGIRITYAGVAFNVAAAFSNTSYAAGDVSQNNVNADWRLGDLKLIGMFSRDKNGAVTAKGGALGAAYSVGVGEARAMWSRYATDAAGRPTVQKLSLGYVHNLSKRTALYGTLARLKNSGGARSALNGASTAVDTSSSGLDLGLRHSF